MTLARPWARLFFGRYFGDVRVLTLNVIGDPGHDARHALHRQAYRNRHVASAKIARMLSMRRFVQTHLVDDCPGFCVGFRQAFHVTGKMRLDLSLGFDHETETGSIPESGSNGAQAIRNCVPEWVQQAGPPVEFTQALACPTKMILFLQPGMNELRRHIWAMGNA